MAGASNAGKDLAQVKQVGGTPATAETESAEMLHGQMDQLIGQKATLQRRIDRKSKFRTAPPEDVEAMKKIDEAMAAKQAEIDALSKK